jgi:hypothetical protein
MDQKQKLLIRNIAGVVILLTLLLFVLAYCGVFEGDQSDEAQIRALIDRSRDEVNDHDWPRLFDLCDLTPDEKQAWINAVPNQAELVHIDSITPRGFISVPEGAVEYELEVSVLAHLEAPIVGRVGPQIESVSGTLFFIKKGDRWFIDWNRSAPTFPYIPRPKLP